MTESERREQKRQEYLNWTLKERAEYWADILDNIRMGIYDQHQEEFWFEAIAEFLHNEVAVESHE